MLTLSYSASYDPYNTVFRMLCILNGAPKKSMLKETMRIADFFVCFPMRLSELRPPNSVVGMRKRKNAALREEVRPNFELLPSSDVLFERMEVFQEAAISALQSKGYVNIISTGASKLVCMQPEALSDRLTSEVNDFVSRHKNLMELVSMDFPRIELHGSDGLKARTGLGEWQYDTV